MRVAALSAALAFVLVAACAKTSATPPAPTKCTADSDCEWSCQARGGCCPSPCGCTIPMHEADKKEADAYNKDFCTDEKRRQCPVVGACAPDMPKPALRCRAGACVSENDRLADAGASPQ